jgi:hypothetical protein
MNNDGKHIMMGMYFFICAFIALSCRNCWKVSVPLITIPIFIRCICFTCYTNQPSNSDIFPIQEVTMIQPRNRNLRVIIQDPPDFSRLYTTQLVKSPLHVEVFCCSICLDDEEKGVITLLCGHRFHQTCIEEWFGHEESCPLCRDEFDSL